ncbi:TPA: permease [Escherichia coli]|nr:permease [Escherichia coli]
MKISPYIKDALQNILENRAQVLPFIIFLILSLAGIIITDSLIYSVSEKAEEELKTFGDNVISVSINDNKTINDVRLALSPVYKSLAFSRTYIFSGGKTPYDDNSLSVTGIDSAALSLYKFNLDDKFEGDVAVVSKNGPYSNLGTVFLTGIPFKIIGVIPEKKTDFLDSLGLSEYQSANQLLIPLDTLFRLTLSSSIDNVKIVVSGDRVTMGDIVNVQNLLNQIVPEYNIRTVLDARQAVDRVLSRFSLLTNTIYVMLTLFSSVICIVLCRRIFSSRGTEFALKIIHGINQNAIIFVVITEAIVMLAISLLGSLVVSYSVMLWLSRMLSADIRVRLVMIALSLTIITLIFLFSNVLFGKLFFRVNPVYIIKGRQL